MKKSMFLLCTLISIELSAQLPFGVFVKADVRTDVESKYNYVKAYSNNLPAAVMTHFVNQYPDAQNVSWYVNNRDISGYFSSGGKNITVNYKKNGLLLSTRKSYDASLLDTRVREFLYQEVEPCYTMKYVTEIVRENETVYEVSMETERDLCIIRVFQKKEQALVVDEKTKLKKG